MPNIQPFQRTLTQQLATLAQSWRLVFLTGPRQSGKTTLARMALPDAEYLTFENPATRELATADPRAILAQIQGKSAILDEVQHAPHLFSWLQQHIDERRGGPMILTGSQNFRMSERIGQTLAGRGAILELLPLSMAELVRRPARHPDTWLDGGQPFLPKGDAESVDTVLFRGFYPRLHADDLAPSDFYASYVQTYVERDVRTLVDVGDLDAFTRFLMLAAGRAGQLVNLSSLGSEAGVSHKTADRWLAVLRASYVIELLQPWHESFSKRVVKAPKLMFLDTGLLCWLLRIRGADDLRSHPLRGSIFENFVYSELRKLHLHHGVRPDLWFWRDSAGHEVDFVVAAHGRRIPIEAKSGMTVTPGTFAGLDWWCKTSGEPGGVLVHGASEATPFRAHLGRSWGDIT